MMLLALTLLLAASPKADAGVSWPESMPLQLAVRSPEDLAFKAAAERQYLIFNLLAGGKLAWDRGDFQGAATRWESLLRTPGLPAELDALVRPLAKDARARVGGEAPAMPEPAITMTPMEPEPVLKVAPTLISVTGVISGGGSHGPGGAVVVLRRADGPTPKPRATRVKAVVQKDKRFMPHVLAVPVGATVEFRNDDELFHNVFSLSKPNDFDLGLYKSGAQREQVFPTAGPVQLLCNIHASMNGWLYVSDSPWFAQADANGRFTVKNVPPGQYELETWHEWSMQSVKQPVKVTAGMSELALNVDGDRRAPAFVPDKAGKQRQPQLGY
jgi:plastocyanin